MRLRVEHRLLQELFIWRRRIGVEVGLDDIMVGPVVPVELQITLDLVAWIEVPHSGVLLKTVKLGQLLLDVPRFREEVHQNRRQRHAVVILLVYSDLPLSQSRQVRDRLIDRPVSQEGLYAGLVELEPISLDTPIALFVQTVDGGLDPGDTAHLISMLKVFPTLPYVIMRPLSTLAKSNSLSNVYDSPCSEPGIGGRA